MEGNLGTSKILRNEKKKEKKKRIKCNLEAEKSSNNRGGMQATIQSIGKGEKKNHKLLWKI